MSRPPTSDSRLTAWLEEGPSTGPDDGLSDALARARSTRQRPGWLVTLRGGTMETTWRARPVLTARLMLAMLITMLLLALVASASIVGSRLMWQPAVAPEIPQGGAAVFAFSLPTGGDGDIYTVRADGSDLRQITSGAQQEFGPAFSPDGEQIAFYENPTNSGYVLRVVDSSGLRSLHVDLGCFSIAQAPAWSPDGRYIVYPKTRVGEPDCDDTKLDLYVVPADGSAPGRRVLPVSERSFTSSASWSRTGDRLAFRSVDENGKAGLWVADVSDAGAPWDLEARPISQTGTYSPFAWDHPRWSPDGTMIATTVFPPTDGLAKGDTMIVAADGSGERLLWPDADADNGLPEWAPDGSHVGVVGHVPGIGTETDAFGLYLLDPLDGERTLVETPPLSGYALGPRFSPDGTRIIGWAPGKETLLVIAIDGSSQPIEIPFGGDASWQPRPSSLDWAPLASPLASPSQ